MQGQGKRSAEAESHGAHDIARERYQVVISLSVGCFVGLLGVPLPSMEVVTSGKRQEEIVK